MTCVQPRVLDMPCCHYHYYNVTSEFGTVRADMTLLAGKQGGGRGQPLRLEGQTLACHGSCALEDTSPLKAGWGTHGT